MNNTIDQLKKLGFSQYEAQAYIALLQHSPLNGYELAKTSGIPRPNVYPVLQKLEERGAIVREDTPEGTRYAPVSAEELTSRLQSQFELSLQDAKNSLSEIAAHIEHEHIWNAHGYEALLEHAQALIDRSEKQLLVAIWPQEAKLLAGSLARAKARGVEVTMLCMAGCPKACDHCQGRIHRYSIPTVSGDRWLVLSPDQDEVLAGEITPAGQALGVRTRQKLMVDLAGWYIRHTIALAAILKDAGSQLEDLLTPETRAILSETGTGIGGGGWLEYMHRLVNRPEQKPNQN